MATKIYTKTGDGGNTSLFNGERVSKAEASIRTLGAIDECNSALGVAIAMLPDGDPFTPLHHELEVIQHALFDIGAAVATPRNRASLTKLKKTRFDSEATGILEQWIDSHQNELPPLKAFILPGGHPAGATLHLARTICRRAECHAVPLFTSDDIDEEVLIYLNRLSDYLFVAARRLNALCGRPETLWQHQKSKS